MRAAGNRIDVSSHRSARAGVPDVGVRANGNAPREVRAEAGGDDASGVQGRGRLTAVPPDNAAIRATRLR